MVTVYVTFLSTSRLTSSHIRRPDRPHKTAWFYNYLKLPGSRRGSLHQVMVGQHEQEHDEYEIVDVKQDLAAGFMLRFENKSSGSRDFKWVLLHEASSEETHAWAKAEQKRVKDKLRVLRRGQSSRDLKIRLLLLEDLLEGEVVEPVKPEWAPKSPSPAGSNPDIPPHASFYPLPLLQPQATATTLSTPLRLSITALSSLNASQTSICQTPPIQTPHVTWSAQIATTTLQSTTSPNMNETT